MGSLKGTACLILKAKERLGDGHVNMNYDCFLLHKHHKHAISRPQGGKPIGYRPFKAAELTNWKGHVVHEPVHWSIQGIRRFFSQCVKAHCSAVVRACL